METLYEAWVERKYRNVEEDIVVDELDGEGNVKGQHPEKKQTRLDGETLEAVLGDDEAPVQSEDRSYVEGLAKTALSEEGVSRTFVRETKTVAEFRPKQQQ